MQSISTTPPSLVFVSAGMLKPKKADNGLAREHRYLNYGLLGLATIASRAGYGCQLIHGCFEPPTAVAQRALGTVCESDRPVVLLSVPSSLAVSWAHDFCVAVKQLNSSSKIVVGGRWVVGDEPGWLEKRLPMVDRIVAGTAENKIVEIIRETTSFGSPNSSRGLPTMQRGESIDQPPLLDYRLLENPADFQPSIEVSRGCGMGCSFCVERDVRLTRLCSPEQIVDQYLAVLKDTGRPQANPYFECSFFRPSTDWIREFNRELGSRGVSFQWRTESRVDSFSVEQCDGLRRAGLTVLDLGLESACPTQLLRMQKTRKPDAYLRRASTILKRLADLGVWAKINVLLYLGETRQTLAETMDWLDEHQAYIKGVSVNPVVVLSICA